MPASKDDLTAAAAALADALGYIPFLGGEVIVMPEEYRAKIAWHLARAGVPAPDPARAVIKRATTPTGAPMWVGAGEADPNPAGTAESSAAGQPVPVPLDLDRLDAATPWHTTTRIQGDFQ